MFRRKPPAEVDPLLHAPLPARVEAAHSRLAHQGDPALIEALSERELRDERAAAELVRDHQRHESIASVKSAQTIAGEVRRAQEEMVRAEAADLVVARRAIAERLRSSSATFDIARLHREKRMAARGLTGVVIASMLWSAANVQSNLAPGGPSDPLFWFSYALEATISIVLVVIMVSGASVSRWNVTEGDERIRRFEIALLLGSIGLNVYPYLSPSRLDVVGAAVHAVAPVMVGVALLLHPVVQRRYGLAIDRAKVAADAEGDDITARLDALTATASRTAPPAAAAAHTPTDEAAVLAQMEAELSATDPEPTTAPRPRASAELDTADRARTDEPRAQAEPARADSGRAPRADQAAHAPRADDDNVFARAQETIARAEATHGTPARELADTVVTAAAHAPRTTTDSGTAHAPTAAHNPVDLATAHAPRAAHTTSEAEPAQAPRADDTDPDAVSARAQDDTAHAPSAPRAVVSLVREDRQGVESARADGPRARSSRTDGAREPVTAGALARATEPAPRARTSTPRADGHGPFDRVLSRADAERFARAVSERGLSKQPAELLADIYARASQGEKPTTIAGQVGLRNHSTVIRALDAVTKVMGPRAL